MSIEKYNSLFIITLDSSDSSPKNMDEAHCGWSLYALENNQEAQANCYSVKPSINGSTKHQKCISKSCIS